MSWSEAKWIVGQLSTGKIDPHIFGIRRNIASLSTKWARTDGSAHFTPPTASVGTTAGQSDFDNCYPWSEMRRQAIGTDIMVWIPEFWFQRFVDNGFEYIRIADYAASGFIKHPGSGRYIGAYKTSGTINAQKSVPGAALLVNQTRAAFRGTNASTGAKAKGAGWSLIDMSVCSAVQMLYLVEFADNNGQARIGRGYCDGNTAAINTGSCDSVPGLTGRPAGTDGKVDMVYRGIEGFWGNVWEFVDGFNFNNGEYWICTDPSKFADDTSSNYTKLSYGGATNWSSSYITAVGCDTANSWVMAPSAAGGAGASGSTFQADGCWSTTDWRICLRGGHWNGASICGVFAFVVNYASSITSANIGSRLLYIPPTS